MGIFLIIWSILWVIGLLLIFLRSDARELLIELYTMLLFKNIFSFCATAIMIYIFIPFTILHSIRNILNIE